MTTKLARALLLALLAALLAVGAGCGGDDDDEGGGAGGIALTQGSDDGGDEGAGGDDGASEVASADECRELSNLGTTLSQAMSGAGTEDAQEQARFFEDFADRTPEDIRADFQVIAEAYTNLTDAIAEADIQPGETPDPEALQALQEATQSIDQEELTAASNNIQKWVEENCNS